MIDFPNLKDVDDYSKVLKLANNPKYSAERKYDGTACMVDIFCDGRDPILYGRGILKNGSQQIYNTNFPEIVEYFSQHSFRRVRLLGELVCFNCQEIEKFSNIQPRVTRKYGIEELTKKSPATFMAFDILILDEYSIETEPYSARRELLSAVVEDYFPVNDRFKVVPVFYTQENKQDLLLELQEKKFEGVVFKNRNVPFMAWKYKPTITEDVIWFGEYNEGTGRNEGMIGSMVCYQYVKGILTEIANVGGLTDDTRAHFTKLSKGGKVSRDVPLVLEVEAMSRGEVTKKGKIGKLRHPRYSRIRTDKSASQCIRRD